MLDSSLNAKDDCPGCCHCISLLTISSLLTLGCLGLVGLHDVCISGLKAPGLIMGFLRPRWLLLDHYGMMDFLVDVMLKTQEVAIWERCAV